MCLGGLIAPLMPADDGNILMAVFYAYFDESGKFADPKTQTLSLCGAVGYESDWISIERTWLATLKDAALPYVKMADAMNWERPFRKWFKNDPNREHLRDALLIKLITAACKYLYGISTIPSSSRDFLNLTEEARRRYRDPVYMAFEASMRLLAGAVPPRDVVHLCYDSSEQYAIKCLQLYHRLRMQNPAIKSRFRALTFAEESEFAGLQLIDIIAYCEREIHAGQPRQVISGIHAVYSQFRDKGFSLVHDWRNRELGDARTTVL